jgi:D-glycero-alpha-D-manno-heptose-7-phosphate kinase
VQSVVVRAPVRVALGGGGTDLPAYYRRHGGLVVSTAIDKYVHMTVSARQRERFLLKHLEWEEADNPGELRHPILRAALTHHWSGGAIELASVGDVPPGTGLGSSGAYAVCAIKALSELSGRDLDAAALAEAASHLEIELVGRSIGKQDQYAAAFGGLRAYEFRPDDGVEVRELGVSERMRAELRDRFLLFHTGQERSAAAVIGGGQSDQALHRVRELAEATRDALEADDLDRLDELLEENWEAKRARAPGTVTPGMDALRERAVGAGARGVLSLGAGGGGFLLVHAPDPEPVRAALAGMLEVPFGLDGDGCVALR